MFVKPKDRRIAKEADKIISLKEDLDSVSWGRILEIGRKLETRGGSQDSEIGAELVAIAQSNISLGLRLGIDPHPSFDHTMSSGMDVFEGGLAQAALDSSNSLKRAANTAAPRQESASRPASLQKDTSGIDTFTDDALVSDPPKQSARQSEKDQSFMPSRFASAPGAKKIDVEKPAARSGRKLSVKSVFYTVSGTSPKKAQPEKPAYTSEAMKNGDTFSRMPAVTQKRSEEHRDQAVQTKKYAAALEKSPKPSDIQEKPEKPAAPAREEHLSKEQVACFRNLYESRDGGLCTFMDDQGHLVSFDSSKLV